MTKLPDKYYNRPKYIFYIKAYIKFRNTSKTFYAS